MLCAAQKTAANLTQVEVTNCKLVVQEDGGFVSYQWPLDSLTAEGEPAGPSPTGTIEFSRTTAVELVALSEDGIVSSKVKFGPGVYTIDCHYDPAINWSGGGASTLFLRMHPAKPDGNWDYAQQDDDLGTWEP